MITTDLWPLGNHLWQSTLFAAGIWLLTLMLRKNRAGVRYWLWLTASVKFLIPFSLLISAGSLLRWPSAPAISRSYVTAVLAGVSRPFVNTTEVLPHVAALRTTRDLSVILAVRTRTIEQYRVNVPKGLKALGAN